MNTNSPETHKIVVDDLKILLSQSPEMAQCLEASIVIASEKAQADLNADLYQAIDRVFDGKGWPKTIETYYDYLDLYVRLVPNEESDPAYPAAWTTNDQENGYNQKVYDLLCQFYWLVDQKPSDSNQSMQSFPKFADWLVKFAKAWGSFLDTPASLTAESLKSFKDDPMYNFPLYAENEAGWKTFNQFFYREFNDANKDTGLSPLRPIAAPENNRTITAPADCTFKQNYPIDRHGNVLDSNGQPTKITLKHTHSIGTVQELLDGSEYADDFNSGTFVHYFLGPFDYHRFHTPVKGKILEIKDVSGKVYLNVEMTADGQWDAPDGSEDGYEFNQARGLVIMDAGPDVGKVAILPIGMAQVSGVEMYTQLEGETVVKGHEFGRFKFGGSDIIMLFEKAPNLYFFKKDPGHNPIHFQYGQTAAYWNLE